MSSGSHISVGNPEGVLGEKCFGTDVSFGGGRRRASLAQDPGPLPVILSPAVQAVIRWGWGPLGPHSVALQGSHHAGGQTSELPSKPVEMSFAGRGVEAGPHPVALRACSLVGAQGTVQCSMLGKEAGSAGALAIPALSLSPPGHFCINLKSSRKGEGTSKFGAH